MALDDHVTFIVDNARNATNEQTACRMMAVCPTGYRASMVLTYRSVRDGKFEPAAAVHSKSKLQTITKCQTIDDATHTRWNGSGNYPLVPVPICVPCESRLYLNTATQLAEQPSMHCYDHAQALAGLAIY